MSSSDTYPRIYRVVSRIPRGRVATYGQIAELAGIPRGARQVGYALAALREDAGVPWHRVLNARGEISARFESIFEDLQRSLLMREGVRFGADGRVSLERFRWRGSAQPSIDSANASAAGVRQRKSKRASPRGTSAHRG